MSIIAFPCAPAPQGWRSGELQELMGFFAERTVTAGSDGASWEIGMTERGEPQFYVLGPAPGHDCVLCISRLGATYVLEDGRGQVVAEAPSLATLFAAAARAAVQPTRSLLLRFTLLCCAVRLTIEEKLEPIMEESMELFARFAPCLAVA